MNRYVRPHTRSWLVLSLLSLAGPVVAADFKYRVKGMLLRSMTTWNNPRVSVTAGVFAVAQSSGGGYMVNVIFGGSLDDARPAATNKKTSLSDAAPAETPWEAYLRAPTPAAAAAVRIADYSVPDPERRKLESDLRVLANEVAAGDTESTKLAVRLSVQLSKSSDIAEYLDDILGRSIRPNPVGYLQAIAASAGCPGLEPAGDLYVDRDAARAVEARARLMALKRVNVPALKTKRDECVARLEKHDAH